MILIIVVFFPSQILQTVKAPGQRQAAGIEVSCQFLVIQYILSIRAAQL